MLSIICTGIILAFSWAYTLWTLSSPERMQFFNYVMLAPAPIAFCFYLYESRSLKKALRPLTNIPSFGSLCFSILFPPVFLSLLALLVLVFGLGTYNQDNLFQIIKFLPKGSGLVFAMFLLIGEEYAWRGYLLPRFTEAWGPIVATTVIGFIWAIWHGPLVYGLASKLGTTDSPLFLSIVQMGAVFILSFPFAYAYFKSGSIIPPVIIHFLWNWLNPAILGNVYRNQPGIIAGNLLYINGETIAGVALGSLFVFWFIWQVSKRSTFSNLRLFQNVKRESYKVPT